MNYFDLLNKKEWLIKNNKKLNFSLKDYIFFQKKIEINNNDNYFKKDFEEELKELLLFIKKWKFEFKNMKILI